MERIIANFLFFSFGSTEIIIACSALVVGVIVGILINLIIRNKKHRGAFLDLSTAQGALPADRRLSTGVRQDLQHERDRCDRGSCGLSGT